MEAIIDKLYSVNSKTKAINAIVSYCDRKRIQERLLVVVKGYIRFKRSEYK